MCFDLAFNNNTVKVKEIEIEDKLRATVKKLIT
jgi:hypothetical protein